MHLHFLLNSRFADRGRSPLMGPRRRRGRREKKKKKETQELPIGFGTEGTNCFSLGVFFFPRFAVPVVAFLLKNVALALVAGPLLSSSTESTRSFRTFLRGGTKITSWSNRAITSVDWRSGGWGHGEAKQKQESEKERLVVAARCPGVLRQKEP